MAAPLCDYGGVFKVVKVLNVFKDSGYALPWRRFST